MVTRFPEGPSTTLPWFTRFPIGYRRSGHWLDGLPLEAFEKGCAPSYDGYDVYANNFYEWTGPTVASALPGTGGWAVGQTGTAAVDVSDSQTGGALRVATSAVDNDITTVELNGSGFKFVKGKEAWFGIRMATDATAADGELFFGLGIEAAVSTSPITTNPTDGLFFEKSETATAMDFHARKNSLSSESTALDTTALAANVFHIYGFYIDTDGKIHIIYDNTEVASVAAGNANIPDDEDLTIFFSNQTGAAAASVLFVDWVFAAFQR